MRSSTPLFVAILTTTPAMADNHLPVAPQYYLDTVMGMSLAEQYAWHCPEVLVNGEAIGVAYGAVLEQLAADDIPTDEPHKHMLLPPSEESDAIIHDMLAQHQAADDPAQSFCDGARAEMTEGSIIGSFLVNAD